MAQPDESKAISTCGEGVIAEEESQSMDLTVCPSVDSKHMRHLVQNEMLLRGTVQLDVNIWSALDDHLLEKIIARLPVKYLVQASLLSKAWRLRFCSDSFRSEVQSSSSAPRESSYAPLLVNHRKELVGYESSSQRWCRLPTLSYLHEDLVRHWRLRAGDGPLLCWIRDKTRMDAHANDVFHVTNPITKSWKQLPSRPKLRCPQLVHVVSSWEGGKVYKVILGNLTGNISVGRLFLELQIYDSADGSWILDSYNEPDDNSELGGSAFINGVLHVLVTVEGLHGYKLISFDVNNRIWKEIPYLREVFEDSQRPYQALTFGDILYSSVVVCGFYVVMLVVENNPHWRSIWDEQSSDTVSLFRLDVECGLAFRCLRLS